MSARPPDRLNVVVFAGDVSGDVQSAHLMRALGRRVPELTSWGIGGRRLHEAGCGLIFDTSRSSAIGIVQASKLIFQGLIVEAGAKRRLAANPPDMALAVDFGGFNLRVAPFMKSLGIPVVYWFPPGSWRRTPPSERITSAADLFITPYPWNADLLSQAGANALFLGHPLIDQVKPRLTRERFLERLDLPADCSIIALLPGSRAHEIVHILPVLVEAAALISRSHPGLAFVTALPDSYQSELAASLTHSAVRKAVAKGLPEPRLVLARSATHETICHSHAAAVCSGSATLEALVAGTPMVVLYRGSRMMQMEYKVRRMNIRYMAMPNILADAGIVPELRQDDATPEAVASHLDRLIGDTPERRTQTAELGHLRSLLEPPGAIERTADAILDWYQRSAKRQPEAAA